MYVKNYICNVFPSNAMNARKERTKTSNDICTL